ncbi:hypothetical protein MTO96_035318 [Rhipicephalus appendiculatus]
MHLGVEIGGRAPVTLLHVLLHPEPSFRDESLADEGPTETCLEFFPRRDLGTPRTVPIRGSSNQPGLGSFERVCSWPPVKVRRSTNVFYPFTC